MKQISLRDFQKKAELDEFPLELTVYKEVKYVLLSKEQFDKFMDKFEMQREMIKELETAPLKQTSQGSQVITTETGPKMNNAMAKFLENKGNRENKEVEPRVAKFGTNPFINKCQMMYCKNTKNLEEAEVQTYNQQTGEYVKEKKWLCKSCKTKSEKATYL